MRPQRCLPSRSWIRRSVGYYRLHPVRRACCLLLADSMSEMTITLDSRDEALLLFGSRDQNLRAIREALGIRVIARGDELHLGGDEISVSQAERVFQQLRDLLR